MTSILQRFRLHTRSRREYPVFVENPGLNYTDGGVEIDTATVWVDGRTIFRKTFGPFIMPDFFGTRAIPHGIVGEFSVVRIFGTATTVAAGGQMMPIADGFGRGPTNVNTGFGAINISTLAPLTAFDDCYVTIEYVYGRPI